MAESSAAHHEQQYSDGTDQDGHFMQMGNQPASGRKRGFPNRGLRARYVVSMREQNAGMRAVGHLPLVTAVLSFPCIADVLRRAVR